MKADYRGGNQLGMGAPAARPRGIRRVLSGFTLIELLVVIAIIGILASLGLVVTGAVNRRSKETRVMGELRKLETAIESYRATLNTLPPDNPGRPSINQLYYELTGTTYVREGAGARYQTLNKEETLTTDSIKQIFQTSSFVNSAPVEADVRSKMEIKANQYKQATVGGSFITVLAVPVEGPSGFQYPTYRTNEFNFLLEPKGVVSPRPNQMVNPWLYDCSTTNRNNRGPGQFDLWAEIMVGKRQIRFSNWDRQAVTVKYRP